MAAGSRPPSPSSPLDLSTSGDRMDRKRTCSENLQQLERERAMKNPRKLFDTGNESVGANRGLVIVAVHDIGLDAETNFGKFFNSDFASPIREYFPILAVSISKDLYTAKNHWPSVEDLRDGLRLVLQKNQVRAFVGIGYGFGAYLLSMLVEQEPHSCEGLIFFNHLFDGGSGAGVPLFECIPGRSLDGRGPNIKHDFEQIVAGLLRYHNVPKTSAYQSVFASQFRSTHRCSLKAMMNAYRLRPGVNPNLFKCPVLYIVGEFSIYMADSRKMYETRYAKGNDRFEVFPDCTLPLFEQLAAVMHSVISFLRFLHEAPPQIYPSMPQPQFHFIRPGYQQG